MTTQDVLVILGPTASALRKIDTAAIGFGKRAAELLSGEFDLLLLGPLAAESAPQFVSFGARKIYTLDHADLADYTAEAYTSAVVHFAKEKNYRFLSGTATSASRGYFPRVAARMDIPMASDVLEIDQLSGDQVQLIRAVFVGNLLATVSISGPQVLATCRASQFEASTEGIATGSSVDGSSADGLPIEAIELTSTLACADKKFISLTEQASDRPDLTEAEVIVSGGRGTRGAEGFQILEQLADQLDAAIGCTRAVVDSGWMPNEMQVGQTGKNVAPKLYFAVAISGAIQHLAGMRSSKTVVAINKDPEAPIFEIADLGLVADMFEAVPQLLEALQAED
jgi:electron transfer flavoprotein alpha subunit